MGRLDAFRETGKARKADEDARFQANAKASIRRRKLHDAWFKLKGFEPFDRPPGFWNRFVDPVMELGKTLRDMGAAHHLESIPVDDEADSFAYGLDILQYAVSGQYEVVVERIAPLADGQLDAASANGVEAALRDWLMEHVVRLDYAEILGRYAPGIPAKEEPAPASGSTPEWRDGKPVTPAGVENARKPSNNERAKGNLDIQALAIHTEHPDWTKKRIAEKIGCHPKSLSQRRCPKFNAVWRAYHAPHPRLLSRRGYRDSGGNLDGWDEG